MIFDLIWFEIQNEPVFQNSINKLGLFEMVGTEAMVPSNLETGREMRPGRSDHSFLSIIYIWRN